MNESQNHSAEGCQAQNNTCYDFGYKSFETRPNQSEGIEIKILVIKGRRRKRAGGKFLE
jgi:hypothetical protein